MSENSYSGDTVNPSSPPSGEADPQVYKVAVDAVTDLNIARKNLLIYPSSHEQVQRSIQKAYEKLLAAALKWAPFTLTVAQDRLSVGKQMIQGNHAAAHELVQLLKQRGISVVTILPEFNHDELIEMLRLFSLDPQQFRYEAGRGHLKKLSHIRLHLIDYTKLRLTVEDRIQRHNRHAKRPSTWGEFVSRLMAGATSETEAYNDPGQMAHLINARQVDAGKAVAYYQTMIANMFEQGEGKYGSQATEASELERFHQLVKNLHPGLQHQFLSATLDTLAKHAPSGDIADLVNGMDDEMVVTELQRANAQRRQISPSLLAFIGKIGHLPAQASAGDTARFRTDAQQKVATLLHKEDYETYVDEAYDGLLKRLSTEAEEVKKTGSEELAELKEKVVNALEENCLAATVTFALGSLMKASIDVEEYRDWARQMTFMLDDLIILNAYDPLMQILDTIETEHRTVADAERAKICGLVLDHFHSPAFVATALAAIHRPVTDVDPKALPFLHRLADTGIAEAIEFISAQESIDPDNAVFVFLQQSAGAATTEALERLGDPRAHVVCRALELIRLLNRDEGVEGVRKLMTHEDADVRLEALATLLHFKKPWGVLYLREMLKGPWTQVMARAMQLAGYYKVRAVVPNLVAFLERRGPVSPDLDRRETALRALGEIGDPQVLDVLSKIASRRWSLSNKHLWQLKRVLFESLAGYEYGAVRELLHIGLKQKDTAITSTCWRLLQRGNPDESMKKVFARHRLQPQ